MGVKILWIITKSRDVENLTTGSTRWFGDALFGGVGRFFGELETRASLNHYLAKIFFMLIFKLKVL